MTNKKFPAGTLLIFSLFILIMLGTYLLIKPAPPPAELLGVLRPDFKLLRPFELSDQNNNVFVREQFQGKWSFVFFGYTSCPDICPTTLHVLNSAMGKLEDSSASKAKDVQVVFISVDPQRDTSDKLVSYMDYFNKNFIGVTAEQKRIDAISRQFGAGYALEEESSPGSYLVSHTSAIFLVDPQARLVATFSQPHYASTIVTLFEKIRIYFRQ